MRLMPSRGIVALSVSSAAPVRQNSDAATSTTLSAAIVAMSDDPSRLWGHTRVIDRAVYGTTVVTSVLVVYDGSANLKLLEAVAIILGPVVAMVIGHGRRRTPMQVFLQPGKAAHNGVAAIDLTSSDRA
jgi:hypothetical protein